MALFKIGIVGFIQETMGRSPFLTTEADTTVRRGADILEVDNWRPIHGAVARFSEASVDLIPLIFARSTSGGPVERTFYDAIKAEAVALVKAAGPLDGLLVANHGALEVDGLDIHGDTDFICAMRSAAGLQTVLSVPFDMHGQATPEILAAIDVFSILRTAPHRDMFETGHRAADQMMRVLEGTLRPIRAMVTLPMFVPGEKAMTTQQGAAQRLFALLPDYDAQDGVVEANIFIGFGWNDKPWIGMRAMVITNGDEALARRLAYELALKIWDERHGFQLGMEHYEVDEGLQVASRSEIHPTYLSDSGDNVSAGAGGDLTLVLQRVLDMPELEDVVLPGIYAPQTTAALLAAGAGSECEIALGAEHISAGRTITRTVRGVVEACGSSLHLPSGVKALIPRDSLAPWVTVRIGHVLCSFHGARLYVGPDHMRAMGIDPVAHKIYVVKFGYLLPDLEDIATRFMLLVSDGCANMDFDRLEWSSIVRPAYPMDQQMTWAPDSGALVVAGA